MTRTSLSNKPFFSSKELAEYWGIKIQTLQKWRITGNGPIYFKIGGRCMYPRKAIKEYQKNRVFRATSERITSGGKHDK